MRVMGGVNHQLLLYCVAADIYFILFKGIVQRKLRWVEIGIKR
jgi:hypothetical protein